MPIAFEAKERYTTSDLCEIMRLLRSPEGCPWDREQTHRSIRSDFLEETHEAIEAIDDGDMSALCEELGDVLLQVVFHAQLASEEGAFGYDDVVDGICRKLIVRHPHVFGDATANSAQEVLHNWDAIKRRTKGDISQSELLRHVPRTLPALMRAAKVQGRARRVGFDWPSAEGALQALESEVCELRSAVESGDRAAMEEEIGDVLFSGVNVSRFAQTDAEGALNAATEKFIRRFEAASEMAKKEGVPLEERTPQQLDELWQRAKDAERYPAQR